MASKDDEYDYLFKGNKEMMYLDCMNNCQTVFVYLHHNII